jgi:hypothetical protein
MGAPAGKAHPILGLAVLACSAGIGLVVLVVGSMLGAPGLVLAAVAIIVGAACFPAGPYREWVRVGLVLGIGPPIAVVWMLATWPAI